MKPGQVASLGHALRARLADNPLRTQRLVLRLPRASDAHLIYDGYARDHEAIRWMGFEPHSGIDVTERLVDGWIRGWGERGIVFVIEQADDERFLGVIDASFDGHGAFIGYVLCRPAWGKGFATEAARCLVDLCFDHFGVWRVWATCAPQNPASRRVLEKVGMRHEGLLKRWIVSPLVSLEPRDSDCMAITRDEWRRA